MRSGSRALGADRGGHAEAHRSGGRRELLAVTAEAQEAARPDRVIAGAVGDDRVLGEAFAQPEHQRAEIDGSGHFGRDDRTIEIIGAGLARLVAPGNRGRRLQAFDRRAKGVGGGDDPERRDDRPGRSPTGSGWTWTSFWRGAGISNSV